jgi:hypothetical protein
MDGSLTGCVVASVMLMQISPAQGRAANSLNVCEFYAGSGYRLAIPTNSGIFFSIWLKNI